MNFYTLNAKNNNIFCSQTHGTLLTMFHIFLCFLYVFEITNRNLILKPTISELEEKNQIDDITDLILK